MLDDATYFDRRYRAAFANRSSACPEWIVKHRVPIAWGGLAVIDLCLLGVSLGTEPIAKQNLTYCIIAAAALPLLINRAKKKEPPVGLFNSA